MRYHVFGKQSFWRGRLAVNLYRFPTSMNSGRLMAAENPLDSDSMSLNHNAAQARDRLRQIAVCSLVVGSFMIWGTSRSIRYWWNWEADDEPQPPHFLADLNHAPHFELQLLPGVGPRTAEDIDAYRKNTKSFESPDELDKVRGFGSKRVDAVREHLMIQSDNETLSAERRP